MLFSCGHVIKRWHHEERVDDPFSECEGISFPRQPCHSSIRLWMLLVIQSPSSRSQQWVFRRVPLSQGWLNYLVEGRLNWTIPIIEESMFFSYFNFFEFDFSVQNATLLSKLSSTLNIMMPHTTFFSLFLWNTHTHHSQKKICSCLPMHMEFMVLPLFSTIWETGGLTEWLTGPWQLKYSTSRVTVFCKDGIRFSSNLCILQI